MGRRRLIVQADLTSEEDQAFLAWVKAKLRRRRLAEEIRAGLRLQYEQATGQAAPAYPSVTRPNQLAVNSGAIDDRFGSADSGNRLQRLVQSF